MIDTLYMDKKVANLYDSLNSWGNDNDFYLSLISSSDKLKILDLGCGTGILSRAFAENGHTVIWCDPSLSMLELAKENDKNKKVDWVHAKAQDYTSFILFDLIVMTGHTFQVFLTDEDVLAVFKVIKKCMAKNGLFVFETRNPSINWIKRWSDNTKTIQSKSGETVAVSTNSFKQKDDKISFTHHYKFPNKTIKSSSTLRFLSRDKIKKLLEQEGLKIIEIYGYWDYSPVNDESLEMIFKVIHK